MVEPMFARLVGCVVFAGMLAGLLVAVSASADTKRRDVVAAAEIQHRVVAQTFTRQ